MTNYSNEPGHVRIDFFKPESGKWYMTEMLDMSDFYHEGIGPHDAVRAALAKTRHGADAEKRWVIVVLEPYCENAHPITLTPGRASYEPYPVRGQVTASHVLNAIDAEQTAFKQESHNPDEWSEFYGLHISDAAGWRTPGFWKSTDDPIGHQEFLWRLQKSRGLEGNYAAALRELLPESSILHLIASWSRP